jgi:hypothetical protein
MSDTWNSHVRSLDNPHSCAKTRFQSRFSVNIWCGVFGSQVIGPFVLEDRLIYERYHRFLEDELPLSDVPLHIRREPWLRQDGAPPYFGRQVTVFLNQHFQNHWIGRQGPVPWPPMSPDLTPLDYYLWGRMKSLVYAVKSKSKVELLNRIIGASALIKNAHIFITTDFWT